MPIRHGQFYGTKRRKMGLRLWAALRCLRLSESLRSLAVIMAIGLWLGLLALSFATPQAAAADDPAQLSSSSRPLPGHEVAAVPLPIESQSLATPQPKRASFGRERKSQDARRVADWIVDSGDSRGMPFMIVDKTDARVFVFDANGRLYGAASVLLGLARGDDSIPGIGDRKLSEVRPEERTTPAGRFVASLGYDFYGQDVLWVDYDTSVALHRVVTTNPKERRLQRLASPTPQDKRISYGCLNVSVKFFNSVVSPAFTETYGIVYVLPEIRSISEVFASYYAVD